MDKHDVFVFSSGVANMRDNHDFISTSTMSEGARFSEKVCREIYVLGAGTVGGALTEAAKHPVETGAEIVGMSLATAGLTALSAAELPVISALAVGTGAIFTGQYVWNFVDPNSVHNQERNRAFRSALDTASISSEPHALNAAIDNLQRKAGSDSLQVIEGLIALGAVKVGVRIPGRVEQLAVTLKDKLPQGPQLNFATVGEAFNLTSWKNLSSRTAPTFEEFVNFKAVPGSLRKFPIPDEPYLDASGKVKPVRETAGRRLYQRRNNTANVNDDALPPPQGNGQSDLNYSIYFAPERHR